METPEQQAPDARDDRRARWLLGLGAAAGIALAGFGLARSGPDADAGRLPPGAVAVVNGQPVALETFERFADAVAAERRRGPLDDAERARLLERLVDEELLFQRGLELGLARHEPTARRAIVQAVIAAVTSDAEDGEPDEATLRAFHAAERERFTRPGRLEVEAAFVSAAGGLSESEAYERAAEIARRARAAAAAGEPPRLAERGDPPVAPLPAGPLPLETLRQYLGPTAALAAERLEPGEVSDPIRGVGGYHVLRLRARRPGEVAPFEEVRPQVRREYLRAQGERALRETLERLRADAAIRVDEARVPPAGP